MLLLSVVAVVAAASAARLAFHFAVVGALRRRLVAGRNGMQQTVTKFQLG